MRAIFYAIALVTGAECSQELASARDLIMRAVESMVQLPAGAKPLEEYSRNYASLPDGKVIGIYVLPSTPETQRHDIDCEVALERGTRPCTDAEKAEIMGGEKAIAKQFGQANQSRWFDDYLELPMITDGGCELIEIIFDPHSQSIQSAQCDGAV